MLLLIVAAVVVVGGLLAAGGWIYVASNVERPDYRVVQSDGAFEIRDYPELIVAEAQTDGSRDDGVRQGFRAIAGYIFAKNRPGPKIAMTAPVTQTPRADAQWTVQFIMPSEHTLDALPAPGSRDVQLSRIPAGERAAIRFSGVADDPLLARKTAELQTWLSTTGREAAGPPVYAYYNDPFTPGFLRRNEVLFDLKPAD